MIVPDPKQFAAEDENLRADRRFKIELPVLVNTAIEDQHGWIIDVSRKGLKLWGINAPPRSRVFIHYKGDMAEGTVRWYRANEGIGVILDQPLKTGPLAAVWHRFHENVAAFGKHQRPAKPVFGRKA
jgi:hypothetical protein